MKTVTLGLVAATLAATPTFASEYDAAMSAYFDSNLSGWVADPVIVAAIAAQNVETSGYGQAEIDGMEQQWSAQVGTSNAPLVDAVLGHSAADFLRDQVDASGGAITEVFIMDALGLNVAASHATSDVWQGDEAKFLETFAKGANSVHYSDIEFDESTQTYQGQISVSIVDPTTGDLVGAITIGVNAEALL